MASSTPRLRILCFHAFRLSGSAMQLQMTKFSNFAAAIADLADLDYTDGGRKLADDEAASAMPAKLRELFPPPYFEWWNARDTADGVVYDHLDQSLAKIEQHIAAHGPYDGYLGFSQGGSVAHLLSALSLCQQQEGFGQRVPPPRFAILLSCRTSRHVAHSALMAKVRERPMALNALVLSGGKDQEVPAEDTRQMAATIEPSRVVELHWPEGTHRIPKLNEEQQATVRSFLEAQIKPSE